MMRAAAVFLAVLLLAAWSPDDLPSYVKIYPGAQVISTEIHGKTHVVDFVTHDSPAEVAAFYNGVAASNQFMRVMDQRMIGSGQRVLVFQRALSTSSSGLSITIGRKGSETLVSLDY
jgi:hypothetical protein